MRIWCIKIGIVLVLHSQNFALFLLYILRILLVLSRVLVRFLEETCACISIFSPQKIQRRLWLWILSITGFVNYLGYRIPLNHADSSLNWSLTKEIQPSLWNNLLGYKDPLSKKKKRKKITPCKIWSYYMNNQWFTFKML
jgi:hypothetical protein